MRVRGYVALGGPLAVSALIDLANDVAKYVTASASGLDPDISVANARLQAAPVADARGLSTRAVRALIDRYTTGRTLDVLGERAVNVLELNLSLDRQRGADS